MVGIPIGISLSLATRLKSLGMWIGLACASLLQFFGYCFCMCALNWKKESELAKKRAVSSNGEPSEREENDEQQGLEGDNIILKSYTPLKQDEEDIQEKDTNMLNGSFSHISHDGEENSLNVNEEKEQLVVTDQSEGLSYHIGCLLSPHFKSHFKLLVTHGGLFLIGFICCIGAGIISMYHPPESIFNGNYSECSYDFNVSETYPTSIYLNPSPTP